MRTRTLNPNDQPQKPTHHRPTTQSHHQSKDLKPTLPSPLPSVRVQLCAATDQRSRRDDRRPGAVEGGENTAWYGENLLEGYNSLGVPALPTVQEVTGRPATAFAVWAREHRRSELLGRESVTVGGRQTRTVEGRVRAACGYWCLTPGPL